MKKTPRHLWNHSGGQASHHGEDWAVGDDRITAASKNISDLDKNVVHKIGAKRKFFHLRGISGNDWSNLKGSGYAERITDPDLNSSLKTTYFTDNLDWRLEKVRPPP